MSYNSRYFVDKQNRAKQAQMHTEKMNKEYKDEILFSCKNSLIFDDANTTYIDADLTPDIYLDDEDSVLSAFKYNNGKTAILNFSSYKNPGGMFLKGSKAQEECLCHASFLYNVLKEHSDFYKWNNEHKNKALYLNRAIYTPYICFFNGEYSVYFDVITCAAPNKSAFIKYNSGKDNEVLNENTLKNRIEFIHNIAQINKVDTLILGAYGCGVFGQDANTVASFFKEAISKSTVKTIVFAIPSNMDKNNFLAFKAIFDK